MQAQILVSGRHQTIRFAARELARHLAWATGRRVPVVNEDRGQAGTPALRVGLCRAFDIAPPASVGGDDDWICLRGGKQGVVLCGSNPRSVLFAVYRYLRELGFRWVRPGGRDETVVPGIRNAFPDRIRIAEQAAYRYRTLCIEGACSEQHVVDLIDWQAKHGLNGYFIQFDFGSGFWKQWYEHRRNPFRKGATPGPDRIRKIVARVVREIEKRDLCFERMGHGWTCLPLGVEGEGWDPTRQRVPPAKRRWLAEVNGNRDLWGGVALNTNLCYSNPAVRKAMARAVTEYARRRPEVSAVHLWLADGSNNNCECERCRKARPSDFYVELLNEVDASLTAAGLLVKIVFLIYVDLLWPPERARFRNPDRFVLMFAPITRNYLESFADARRERKRMRPFKRNRLVMPRSAGENLAYLRAWQKVFRGRGFDFDYHNIWACYYDLAQFTLARVLHRDIRALRAVGLDGLNSCQNQRAFFPHPLLMHVLARTLWDPRRPFDAIVRETFGDAYGRDGQKAAAFFAELSRLWKPLFHPLHQPVPDRPRRARARRNLERIPGLLRSGRTLVRKNRRQADAVVARSWAYLEAYLDLMDRLVPAFRAYVDAAPDTRQAFERATEFLWRNEPRLHRVLDVYQAVGVLEQRVAEAEAVRADACAGSEAVV